MSTNIKSFKVKSIHLVFPLRFDFQGWVMTQPDYSGMRWCIEGEWEVQANLAKNTWMLRIGSDQRLSGKIEGDSLVVTDISCDSDGSAITFQDVLLPLFAYFVGSLKALLVWDDGDVYRLSIEDGRVSEEKID